MYSVLVGALRNKLGSLNAVNYIPDRLQPLICSEKMVRLWVVLQPVRHYWPGKKSEAFPHWIALFSGRSYGTETGSGVGNTVASKKKLHSPIKDNMRDFLNILKYCHEFLNIFLL